MPFNSKNLFDETESCHRLCGLSNFWPHPCGLDVVWSTQLCSVPRARWRGREVGGLALSVAVGLHVWADECTMGWDAGCWGVTVAAVPPSAAALIRLLVLVLVPLLLLLSMLLKLRLLTLPVMLVLLMFFLLMI
jgi:hypothetical protein